MKNVIKNKEIARILGLTERTIFNKRTGKTEWLYSEYLKLISYYGEEVTNVIMNIEKEGK